MEWISTKDKLPDERKQVLGWNKEYGCFVCVLDEELDDDNNPGWSASNLMTGVGNPEPYGLEYAEEYPTHWTELPEPPKDLIKEPTI